jgi:uncharacterized protein YjdB
MLKALARFVRVQTLVLFALLMALPFVGACGRSDLEGPKVTADAGLDSGADAALPGTLLGLNPSPSPVIVAVGESVQIALTARFDTGAEVDVAARATWTSTTEATATVLAGNVTGVSAGATFVAATWGGITARVPVTVRADKPVRVEVSPAVVTIGVGATATLQAFAVFADGTQADVSTSSIWSSADSAVSTVDPTGSVTGVAAGRTSVSATYGVLKGAASIAVTTSPVTALRIDPATSTLTTGASDSFVATAIYADGTQADVTAQSVWTATDTTIATATNPGSFTAAAVGSTDVIATFSGAQGKATLTVVDTTTVVQVVVSPASASMTAGATKAFTATVTKADGSTADITTTAVWTVDLSGVATVSSAAGSEGVVQAVGTGDATLTATFGGKSGTATITVSATPPTLVSLAIAPSPVTVAFGATTQLTATGTYSDGSTQDLTASALWASGASATASVSQGLVSAVATGTTTVKASVGAVTAVVDVTVTAAPLTRLTIIPASFTLDVGGTAQARAQGTFADGTTSDVTEQCAWTSADPAVADVSTTSGTRGALRATGPGTATIAASLQGIRAQATVTVRTPITYRLSITPDTATIRATETQAFTATKLGSDGSSVDVTATAVWASSSPTVATLSGAVATGVNPGSTTIAASESGLSASATLTVTSAPVVATSLAVSPTTATIAVGATTTFVATLTFSDGSTQDVTASARWASSATAVATVTSGATVGVAAGTANITATASGFSATASVTVTAIPPGIVRLELRPSSGTLTVGARQAVTVIAVFSDTTTQDVTAQAAFSSNAPAVASVSSATITGVSAGSATILASYSGLTASGTWTITSATPTLTSIVVTLTPATINAGATANAIATAVYSDGSRRDVSNTATWASSQTSVATVQTRGNVTVRGVAAGTSSISATVSGISGSATVTVSAATITNLLILPTSATMAVGDTRSFTAQAVYSNNTTVDVTSQGTWASATTSVATVSDTAGSKGSVVAAGAGTANITVTFGGRTATARVTVARITGIAIRVTNLANAPPFNFVPPLTVGQNFQLYAMATFSNGTTQDVTSLATWSSSNPSILFANDSGTAKGQVTGIARGTAQVRVSYQGQNAQQNLTVR